MSVHCRHIALFLLLAACAAGASAQLVPNLGGQRAGISAFQFLKIGVGARGVAMGESFVASANDVSALYWNPAGLAQAVHGEFSVGLFLWSVRIINWFMSLICLRWVMSRIILRC